MLDWNHKSKEDGVKVCVGPAFLAIDLGNDREKVKDMGSGHPSIGEKLLKSVVERERGVDVGKSVVKGRDYAILSGTRRIVNMDEFLRMR